MAIFLDKLNIANYKISSEDHVWNLVYINDKWLHLDLTWNDTDDSYYQTLYFLIDNSELFKYDKDNYHFDDNFYIEAK